MPTVVSVKFAYSTRELWFNPGSLEIHEGDHLICDTARGTEIGLALREPFEISDAELKSATEDAPLRRVLRVATEEDLAHADEIARKGDEALPVFRSLIEKAELDMKPVGVEYLFGGEKCVCYFAAEERQDFRQLVRDLARELDEKIDMRQIGVREEAAIVGGYAHCGQELCCARFGREFEPVSIRMAKEQDLPLNSTKISGVCGRLMCCLRYEFEAYRDFKSRAPKKNAVIDTPLGTAKIVEYDTPKEQITLRLENGKQMRIPIAEMEASEAAVKKSEELGCACRPDTVLRSTLDKLDSPEVRLALAELDRANGVIPEETFDDSDIFVNPKPRKRGRGKQQGQAAEGAGEEKRGRRRRRRGGSGASAQGDGQSADKGGAAGSAASEKGGQRRTRRRHHSGSGAEGAAGSDTAQRSASGSGQGNGRGGQGGQGGSQGGAQKKDRAAQHMARKKEGATRRRRPGDRGGTVTPPSTPGSGGATRRRRRRRSGGEGGGDAGGSAE